jgi:hypothetical protein
VEKVRERGDQTIEVSVGQSNLSRGHKRETETEGGQLTLMGDRSLIF